jgi:hypothetical protein
MFPLTNIDQAQARDPSARNCRRTVPSFGIIGAAAIALLAAASSFADAAETTPRMAQEQHACAVVMGLHQPGDLYDTCIRSLNKTLSGLDWARLVSKDRTACVQEGLQPSTPAFALCVVNAEQSPADASRHAGIAAMH